jgi:hypothetical protein
MATEERPEHASTPLGLVVLAWLVVSVPLGWGVLQTLEKAAALFR